MSEELDGVLRLVRADYAGCHNCKHYHPDVGWDMRGTECQTCIPTNWKPKDQATNNYFNGVMK